MIYRLLLHLRHRLYDKKIIPSTDIDIPAIGIGNLSFGGTGKTPMVEYIIRLLQSQYRVGVLSRGYGRKTKGFVLADEQSDANSIGDEPYQYKNNFPDIVVAVDGNRRRGLQLMGDIDVVVLDDVLQHRAVNPSLSVLLTTHQYPYCDDTLAPMGTLRDICSRADAADIIIVTKCPKKLSKEQRSEWRERLQLKTNQQLFFTYISYSKYLFSAIDQVALSDIKGHRFTLLTGIADASPLVCHLKSKGLDFEHLSYPDHHYFSKKELNLIRSKNMIVTTEKDSMRLNGQLEQLYTLPIRTRFVADESLYNKLILEIIAKKTSS